MLGSGDAESPSWSRRHVRVSASRLPDFVIIGAPKSATTWLVANLRAQPEIFMPSQEIHFFNRNYQRGLGWYEAQLSAARQDQIVGEKSASYLAHPEVPHRLRAALPQAKLIVQLRNPVERAYSDYCMLLRRGEVRADINRYLDVRSTSQPRFLEDGLYGRHLQRFLELFPRQQILIILYDDIGNDPAGVFAQVAGFLGLRQPAALDGVARRVKDRTAPMLPLALRRLAKPFKGLVAPYRGRAWFQSTHALFARPVRYPPLDAELRCRLQQYYAPDVSTVAALLGRDLSSWLDPSGPRRRSTGAERLRV